MTIRKEIGREAFLLETWTLLSNKIEKGSI